MATAEKFKIDILIKVLGTSYFLLNTNLVTKLNNC